MAEKIQTSLCAPPHREKHVVEIGLMTDEVIEPGTDGSWFGIGEITVDNDRLEFEIYAVGEDDRRVVDCKQLAKALHDGIDRLIEIYPQLGNG